MTITDQRRRCGKRELWVTPMAAALCVALSLMSASFAFCQSRDEYVIDTLAYTGTPFTAITLDAEGNVYVSCYEEHRIRKIAPTGAITVVAGNGIQGFSGDGGPATAASLNWPMGVAVDASGNLYIVDHYNDRIRRVDRYGIITTTAGTGVRGFSGDGGPAIDAQLNLPYKITVGSDGSLYFPDSGNYRVRKIAPSGIITTVAGNGSGEWGPTGDGGPALNAGMGPRDVVLDRQGNLYIAEHWGDIRKVDTNGIITTVLTGLVGPHGVALDAQGVLYATDSYANRIRKMYPSGVALTIAGTGKWGLSGDGGPALNATFQRPMGVAVDGRGIVYVADEHNYRVRRLTPVGLPAAARPSWALYE